MTETSKPQSIEQRRIAEGGRDALDKLLADQERAGKAQPGASEASFRPDHEEPAVKAAEVLKNKPGTNLDTSGVVVDPEIQRMYQELDANPVKTLNEWIANPEGKSGKASGEEFNNLTEALRERFKDVDKN